MNDSLAKLRVVASYGGRYRRERLNEPPDDPNPPDDPFLLRFLLKRAFAGARSEQLSADYREYTENVLRNEESEVEGRWSQSEDAITDEKLLEELEEEGVGNQHDRQMVVGILDLIERLEGEYINQYTKCRIRDGAIDEVYDRLTSIHNIGSKKATLYLRDLVAYYDRQGEGLEDKIAEDDDYCYLIPIDTWVFQIGRELGIFSTESPSWTTNSNELIDACDGELSPLSVDQGAWYLGANAFDVVVENLADLEPKTDD